MRLPAVIFLRRFLLHVLPSGFMRIRHYGFLANRARKKLLPLAQRLAARDTTPLPDSPSTRPVEPVAQRDPRRCPACGERAWRIVAIVAPEPADIVATPLDTS